ncbi:hypothetical protein KC842_01145 [Candidatus Nomurabacteria bacterium]|nr:hypothetical protein [Candidatus Nomurabacteria bacterium]USN94679.1 MAG: hypothetical protein H6791_02895 [Candidatus Nomurabacteria bacterium]
MPTPKSKKLNKNIKLFVSIFLNLSFVFAYILGPVSVARAQYNQPSSNQGSLYYDQNSPIASGVGLALLGCTGTDSKISGALNNIFDKAVGTTNASLQFVPVKDAESIKISREYTQKEKCLDAIGYAAAKSVLAAITRDTVNWINTGFEGNPLFLSEPISFLKTLADQEVYAFVSELNDPVKYPFGAEIGASLAAIYDGQDFESTAVFTLADDIGENWEDFATDFSVGGWNGWLAMTQNPANSPIGFNFLASQEINKRIEQKQSSIKDELLQNNGFLNLRKCVEYKQTVGGVTYTTAVSGNTAETTNTAEGLPEGLAVSSNPLLGGGGSNLLDGNYEYAWAGEVDNCTRYETTTPGGVLADQLNISLGSSVKQLELADELNESLGAIFDALMQQLIYQGVTSLTTASVTTDQTGGYGVNTSYYLNGEGSTWYQDPFSPVDLYYKLQCVKYGNIISGADIGGRNLFGGGVIGTGDITTISLDDILAGGIADPDTGDVIESGLDGVGGGVDVGGGIFDDGIGIEGGGIIFGGAGALTTELFGPRGSLSGTIDFSSDAPCRTDIAVTEEYIEILKQNIDYIQLVLLPKLQQLDKVMPEPDQGWQARVTDQYLTQREEIMTADETVLDIVNALYALPLSGVVAGISHALGFCWECNIEEKRRNLLNSIDLVYQNEMSRIQYDIDNFNLPSASLGRAQTQKIPAYKDLLEEYRSKYIEQVSNLYRLQYIADELDKIPYAQQNTAENQTALERLQYIYSFAQPFLVTDDVITSLKTDLSYAQVDLESTGDIIPKIESEIKTCGWGNWGCVNYIENPDIGAIAGDVKSHLLRNYMDTDYSISIASDSWVYDSLYQVVRQCYPDGINMRTTVMPDGSSASSICSYANLQSKGVGNTIDNVKNNIWRIYLYDTKSLYPLDVSANPYSIYYPFRNPPYNPWGFYQIYDPTSGSEPIVIDGGINDIAQNIWQYHLSFEARAYGAKLGAQLGDENYWGPVLINPWINSYENPDYGY